jgi:hypothetical protein
LSHHKRQAIHLIVRVYPRKWRLCFRFLSLSLFDWDFINKSDFISITMYLTAITATLAVYRSSRRSSAIFSFVTMKSSLFVLLWSEFL